MHANNHISFSNDDPIRIAVDMLSAVREGGDPSSQAEALACWPIDDLADALGNDLEKVAFWSNVYNALTQRALRGNPELYEHRRQFFNTDLVTVAGRSLSLDEIEHHIIRRGYVKWSLGYFRWPFRSDYAQQLSPTEREPRLHFALNCGAESCPVIRPYSRADIDVELDRATRAYLDDTVEYAATEGRVILPKVFRWFRGDFGGKRGILDFLQRYEQLPPDVSPRFGYREWDWSLALGQFA